jgi:hypothetical protein
MIIIKQISVFIENKPGRLKAMTKILKDNDIDILAISIADTKDFGILRLIVNDPEKASKALKDAECTVKMTDVLAIQLEDRPGGLAKVMDTLFDNSISVEYMYAFFSKQDGQAAVILRVDDNDKAADAMENAGIKLITSESIKKM